MLEMKAHGATEARTVLLRSTMLEEWDGFFCFRNKPFSHTTDAGENHPWNKNPRQMPYKKGVFGYGQEDDDASSVSSDSDKEDSPKVLSCVDTLRFPHE